MHGTIDLAGDAHQRAAHEKAQSIPLADLTHAVTTCAFFIAEWCGVA